MKKLRRKYSSNNKLQTRLDRKSLTTLEVTMTRVEATLPIFFIHFCYRLAIHECNIYLLFTLQLRVQNGAVSLWLWLKFAYETKKPALASEKGTH